MDASENGNELPQETIEVNYRRIGSVLGIGYYHKCLIYTDSDGQQRTISGWTGDVAPGLPFGRIHVESDLPYDANNPDHPDNLNALGQAQYRELIVCGDDLSGTWNTMVENARAMDDRYPYDPLVQNSNTLADSVLRSVDLPEPELDGFFRHWSPASGNALDESLEPKVPGFFNSSRMSTHSSQASSTPEDEATLIDTLWYERDDPRNPTHPDHLLHQDILDGVHRLDEAHGRTPDSYSNRLALSLTAEARQAGMTRADQVVLSQKTDQAEPGAYIAAIQGDWDDPTAKRAMLSTQQAINTPEEKSLDVLSRVNQEQEQRREQALQRGPDQPGPSGFRLS